MNGMAIHDWDTEKLIGHTEAAVSFVRRMARDLDGVVSAVDGAGLGSRACTAVFAKPEAAGAIFERAGRVNAKPVARKASRETCHYCGQPATRRDFYGALVCSECR